MKHPDLNSPGCVAASNFKKPFSVLEICTRYYWTLSDYQFPRSEKVN